MTDYLEAYRHQRKRLAGKHDDGAEHALTEVFRDNTEVECMAYCYGGTARMDTLEVLADLAESGWRLVRAEMAA